MSAVELDRLWRGDRRVVVPELAGQEVYFAVLEVERDVVPLPLVGEHYPLLVFGADGRLDQQRTWRRLQLEVDLLEAHDYGDMVAVVDGPCGWVPDEITRRRVIAALEWRLRVGSRSLRAA